MAQKNITKGILKNTVIAIIMQTVIMFSHFFIHEIPYKPGGNYPQVICSFAVVILITCIATLAFNIRLYSIFVAQIITILFVFVFEEEGAYLCYYLLSGNWLNPDVYTDALVIMIEMCSVQLASFLILAIAKHIYNFLRGHRKSNQDQFEQGDNDTTNVSEQDGITD